MTNGTSMSENRSWPQRAALGLHTDAAPPVLVGGLLCGDCCGACLEKSVACCSRPNTQGEARPALSLTSILCVTPPKQQNKPRCQHSILLYCSTFVQQLRVVSCRAAHHPHPHEAVFVPSKHGQARRQCPHEAKEKQAPQRRFRRSIACGNAPATPARPARLHDLRPQRQQQCAKSPNIV